MSSKGELRTGIGQGVGKKNISVIIVTCNTRAVTLGCIESVLKFSGGDSPQIVVIDNASSDGTRKRVRERFPDIDYIYNTENAGFSKAVNQGILAASGSTLLFLNSDTVIQSPVFHDITSFFEKNPETGIMGGKITFPDGSIQLSSWKFPNLFREFAQRVFVFRVANRFPVFMNFLKNRNRKMSTDWVTGAFLAARRELFNDIGLFDEKFFMYYEDTDICKRAKDKGWGVTYNPEIPVMHYDALSRKKNPGRIYREARRSQIYYYGKHLGGLQTAGLKWVVSFVMRLNILRFQIKQWLKGKDSALSGRISIFRSVLEDISRKER